MLTGTVVLSMAAPPESSLSTATLYWPELDGLVIEPAGMLKPYSVVLVRLADVRPVTKIVCEALVTVEANVPGKAVMLAGVSGRFDVVGVGLPSAKVKLDGKVSLTLDTVVGVVLNLTVTNKSLPSPEPPEPALTTSRPSRNPA